MIKNSIKYSFFIFVFLILHSTVFAQKAKFDSLKAALPKITSPEKRAILLIDIARSIYNSIPDSSIGYCEEAEVISRKYNLEVQLAYSLHCECRYLLLKGDVKTTIEKLNNAILLFEKNNEQKGLAKAYSLKSIALGRIYKNKEGLDYLIKAKNINLLIKDNQALKGNLQNLANTYINMNLYKKAIESLKEIDKLNLPKSDRDFYTELNYGNVYFKQNKISESITHLKKAVEISHQHKMLDSEITSLTHLAECYQKQNNLLIAKSYYFQALDLAKQNNLLVEEADALKGMIDLFETEHDYQNAFISLKKYKSIQDSIFTIEKIKSINNIENKLQLVGKEKIITEQNLSLEKEKLKLASSKTKHFF